MAGAGSESRLMSLPMSRIRVIMKSSPDVSNINQDALLLTTKATELFVRYLAAYSYKNGTGKQKKELTYDDLSNTAEESDVFQFLADILPKKISVAEYLQLLKKEEEGVDNKEGVTEVEIDVDQDNDDDDEEEEEDDDGEGEEEEDEDEDDDDDDEEGNEDGEDTDT